MLYARRLVCQLVSIGIICLGFTQFSMAGVVGSNDLLNAEARGERISKIETSMARVEVAAQLQAFGVSPDDVMERVQYLTDQELMQLEQTIDEQVAGAGAIGVIGVVFLVLMILELVGVTDIFKSF